MTVNLLQQPVRLLLLGALFSAPLASMANNLVSTDHSESVVNQSNTWLSRAGSRNAAHLVENEHPMSFAHAARERVHGQPGVAAVFSRDGVVTRNDVWAASFLSDASEPGSFVSVTTPVPEPGTYVLMLAGLAAIGFVMRRRRST
jgi:PEP-CTERM motif